MSEILRVDRVVVPRWGRASGFKLDLPETGFVVLYGPNESGKTSVATALAWLIAGPATQGTLQRFGVAGETLEANAKGRVGNSPLSLRVRVKVTQQSPGAAARETLEAALGDTSFGCREDLTRHMGGDLGGYRRLYWVEALKVADGSNLQEDVSLRAVFGRVNPFKAAESLGSRSQELLGALKGSARAGSARQLQTGIEALDREMSSLSGAKDDWARIETELGVANMQREQLESELREKESELRSVRLALQAVADGVAAKRDSASSDLADTPEPSDADRHLHEQLTTARARIGELRAAEHEEESTRLAYESDFDAVDDSWRQMVAADALGEPGIDAAHDAETRYRLARKDAELAAIERERASKRHQQCTDDSEDLQTRWTRQYPAGPSPEHLVEASRARTSQADTGRLPTGTGRSRPPGRVLGLTGILLGTACGVAAAVLAVAREDWALALVAGVAAAALVVVSYRAVRSSQRPVDPDQLRMAERIQDARAEQDDAKSKLSEAETEMYKQQRRTDSALQEYRRNLVAVGVREEMIEQYSLNVVRHLKAVRSTQLANAKWKRTREKAAARLDVVRTLLLGSSDTHEAAAPSAAVTMDRADATVAGSEQRDERSGDRGAVSHLPDIQDAAGAQALLEAACARVDQHSAAARAAQEADDALKRAVKYDDAALTYIEEGEPGDLSTEESRVEAVRRDMEDELQGIKSRITDLEVEKRELESAENRSVELTLERGARSTQVDKLLVSGLAHHLAATLLHEAAERHRTEQQPGLLRRTQQLACEVADWTNVGVNPHAPTTRRSTGTGNLLVDGPRGEYSDQRLSLGAQTLLYLALRLATVEKQAEARGVRLPLILDDVLVGLDDERAERCLEVLAEFSERHQMILLTCHESTMQRAKAAGAAVQPIPPA